MPRLAPGCWLVRMPGLSVYFCISSKCTFVRRGDRREVGSAASTVVVKHTPSRRMSPIRFERLPNGGHQLSVDGKPFLCRAGELQNSTLSCPSYMRDVWPRLVEGNINTVLGAVCWEDIEPVEGQFTFDDLSEVIDQAREHGVRLVLLWFGSHKNGMSSIKSCSIDAQDI
jgi:hypothetical protein